MTDRVADDAVCRNCGSGLGGLALSGACPECATPVADAVHGEFLASCSRAWVRRLSTGAHSLSLATLATMISLIVIAVVYAAFPSLQVAVTIGYAALAIWTVISVWWLTEPDPGETRPEPALSARRIARYGMLAEVASSPVEAFLETGGFGVVGAAILVIYSMFGVAVLVMTASTTGYVALVVHLVRLARRVPDPRLVGATIWMAWFMVPAMILLSLTSVASGLSALLPLGNWSGLVDVLMLLMLVPGFFGSLIGGFWFVILLRRYRRVLRAISDPIGV